MDDESSKSMEQVVEVPLKEFGEPESEASGGIFDDADYIVRISAGGVANVVACKQSIIRLLIRCTSQPKKH